jgi:hypothetical protein
METTAKKSQKEITKNLISFVKNEFGNIEGYDLFIAKKVYTKADDFFNSKELKKVFSYYAKSELDRHIKVAKKNTFVCAYVISVDAKNNYGRNFKLYSRYKNESGLCVIHEENAMSSMNSAPMRQALIFDKAGFLLTDTYYKKTPEGRAFVISKGITVF